MKTLTHILEGKPLGSMGGLNSPTYFLSLARLSIWNRAYLDSLDHMTFSHCFGVPLCLGSLISEYSQGYPGNSSPSLEFLLGRACGIGLHTRRDHVFWRGWVTQVVACWNTFITAVIIQWVLLVYLLAFFFLSPKHVAETCWMWTCW